MEGWIKLHRRLVDKAIWKCSTPEQKVILITLLIMANHEKKEWEWKGKKFICEPGQFITSLQSIMENCGKGITIQNVRTALNKFEKYEFLTNQSTKTGRLITIVKWALYQNEGDKTNKEGNRELTNSQQRDNKELTPNKNDKNDKKNNSVVVLTLLQSEFMNVLESIDNYPVDIEKDLAMFKRLSNEYPTVNIIEAIKDYAVYKLDNPLTKKSNPRSQINTSFKKCVDWKKCLKKINEIQTVIGVPISESILGEREEEWDLSAWQ